MKTVKFLSLGLLLANGIALANVNVEVAVRNDEVTQVNSAVVAAEEPTVVFNDGVISVEAVVAKEENEVKFVVAQVAPDNTNTDKEVIAAPVIKVLDGQEGVITLASDDNSFGLAIKVSQESAE